jgi:hypothetical protein
MPQEYQSDWWSVEVPDRWLVQLDDKCVSFLAETGVGALQISAYRKDFGEVTAEDLRELSSDHLQDNTNAVSIIVGEFQGRTASWVSGELYWRRWWLRSGHLLVYVTYNRSIDDEHQEDSVVERIVGSLKGRLEC